MAAFVTYKCGHIYQYRCCKRKKVSQKKLQRTAIANMAAVLSPHLQKTKALTQQDLLRLMNHGQRELGAVIEDKQEGKDKPITRRRLSTPLPMTPVEAEASGSTAQCVEPDTATTMHVTTFPPDTSFPPPPPPYPSDTTGEEDMETVKALYSSLKDVITVA